MQTRILVVAKFHDVNALKHHRATPPEILSGSTNANGNQIRKKMQSILFSIKFTQSEQKSAGGSWRNSFNVNYYECNTM